MSSGLRWTNQRKVFGKPLNSQAVIRSKLAEMISRAESMCCNSVLVSISSLTFYISSRAKLVGELNLSNVQHGVYSMSFSMGF